MTKTFTQAMSALHSWGGLIFGWLLFGILLSGSIAVYHSELTVWLTPEINATQSIDRDRALQLGQDYLQTHASKARLWRVELPSARTPITKLTWSGGADGAGVAQLDPVSGSSLTRDTAGGDFYLHYHEGLLIDRAENKAGLFIVGLAGIVMMVACISGIVIHKRLFKDLFVFRPYTSPQRSWLDAHNVLGVMPLPFHLMMAYTGLVLLYWMYIPAGVQALYDGDTPAFRTEAIAQQYYTLSAPAGPPTQGRSLLPFLRAAEDKLGEGRVSYLRVRDFGHEGWTVEAFRQRTDIVSQQVPQIAFDGATGKVLRVVAKRSVPQRVQSFVAAFHWLEWGGPAVRFVYFFAGLMGAVLSASGLVHFTIKRARRAEGQAAWMRFVHILNVATVAGFTVACAAFLWAERLTPLGIADRAHVPVAVFLWVWLAMLIHAGLRKRPLVAWSEQLGLAGTLCVGVPFIQGMAFTHWANGDWVRIGVDMMLVGLGCSLVLGAFLLRKPAWRAHLPEGRPRPIW